MLGKISISITVCKPIPRQSCFVSVESDRDPAREFTTRVSNSAAAAQAGDLRWTYRGFISYFSGDEAVECYRVNSSCISRCSRRRSSPKGISVGKSNASNSGRDL